MPDPGYLSVGDQPGMTGLEVGVGEEVSGNPVPLAPPGHLVRGPLQLPAVEEPRGRLPRGPPGQLHGPGFLVQRGSVVGDHLVREAPPALLVIHGQVGRSVTEGVGEPRGRSPGRPPLLGMYGDPPGHRTGTTVVDRLLPLVAGGGDRLGGHRGGGFRRSNGTSTLPPRRCPAARAARPHWRRWWPLWNTLTTNRITATRNSRGPMLRAPRGARRWRPPAGPGAWPGPRWPCAGPRPPSWRPLSGPGRPRPGPASAFPRCPARALRPLRGGQAVPDLVQGGVDIGQEDEERGQLGPGEIVPAVDPDHRPGLGPGVGQLSEVVKSGRLQARAPGG